MVIYAKHDDKYYRLTVSVEWAEKNDNGALISCGLTVGTDIKESQLKNLISRGKAIQVTEDEYNHSGCQSRCVKRGDDICQW